MSRPVHSMAQYSNAPTKPIGRLAFADNVTEISVPPHASLPPTPREQDFHNDLDPPRSYSDTTNGLKPILTNRNVVYGAPGPRVLTSVKFAGENGKPLPTMPVETHHNGLGSPISPSIRMQLGSAMQNEAFRPMRAVPRCSLSLPLAISQRKGFKWPRPEGINISKANGMTIPPPPKSAPTGPLPSPTVNHHARMSESKLDETYASKGYSWARPKPLRLQTGMTSPSDNQFAPAGQATHQAIMTAALDAIHGKISVLDRRSDKLCAAMERLTQAVEGLTLRLDSGSARGTAAAPNRDATVPAPFEFQRQPYTATPQPSVVANNYTDPKGDDSPQSPRISEATLHGAATPKESGLFGSDPFSVTRSQSYASGMSAVSEDIEVNELMKKRASRGRQQSCWDSETEESDDHDEYEFDNDGDAEDNTKFDEEQSANAGESPMDPYRNESTTSWTSNPSPMTAQSTMNLPTATGLHMPNLPVVHETSTLQHSPSNSNHSLHSDQENHADDPDSADCYSPNTYTLLGSDPREIMARPPANYSPIQKLVKSPDSRSSTYSMSSDSESTSCLKTLPPLPSSIVPSRVGTPDNDNKLLPPIHESPSPNSNSAQSQVSADMNTAQPAPSASPYSISPLLNAYNNSSRTPTPTGPGIATTLTIRNPSSPPVLTHSSSPSPSARSQHSYSSSCLSSTLPETNPPPRAAWYFLYGALADPTLLIELLHLTKPPILHSARVSSATLKYYGAFPAAVATPLGEEDVPIEGAAWYVPESSMAACLRSHEESEGRMREESVDISLLEEVPDGHFGHDEQGGAVKGRMFLWKGDVDGLMNHPAI